VNGKSPHGDTDCLHCYISHEAERRVKNGKMTPTEVLWNITESAAELIARFPKRDDRRKLQWQFGKDIAHLIPRFLAANVRHEPKFARAVQRANQAESKK
jgi:hypothetical protein